jgi:MSHA biogenesis protein MshL
MSFTACSKGPSVAAALLVAIVHLTSARAESPASAPGDPVADALGEAMEAAAAPAAVQPPATQNAPLEPPAPVEERFDVSAHEVPAGAFFMGLVDRTPYNMVLDPKVEGRISLVLQDVTVEDALAAVRDVYGYQYRKTSYGYYVLPPGLQSRIYTLDYLNVRRQGLSQTRVSSGQVSEATSYSEDHDEGASSASTGTSGSRVATLSDTDLWTELVDSIWAIIGHAEGRSVVVSPNTGIVVVRAMPNELGHVEELIERAELHLRRQVVLEAKILEVTLADGFQAGINWASLWDVRNTQIVAGQTGGGTLLGSSALSEIAGNLGILDPRAPLPVEGTETSAFGGAFTLAIESDSFNAFVELLETQGNVRTLSSPRVATVNNQKAVIKVGSDEFFVTDISTTTVTGTATPTTPDVTLTPFFSGIALDVTPQVSADGSIILHVHPSISEVTDQTKVISIGGDAEVLSLPLALSTIRESDSVVRVKSGQVVVLGGLMQDSERNDTGGTPWLNRIPFLGKLFRQQRDRQLKTELVILMRATAVGPDTWQHELAETADRVEKLKRPLAPMDPARVLRDPNAPAAP